MNITAEEAFALLNLWKEQGTVLRVHFSGRGRKSQELQAKIILSGSIINVTAPSGDIPVDLARADFNGDRRASPNAGYGAYLICEFRNDDRVAFYAPLPEKDTDTQQKRRSTD